MKKTLFLPFVLICSLSSVVYAAAETGCGGDAKEVKVKTGDFVKVEFPVKCSANVHSAYDQDASAFAVVAASKKGKNVFGGSTNGGGVKAIDTCQNDCDTKASTQKATGLLAGDAST